MESRALDHSADSNDDLTLYRAARKIACELMNEHPGYFMPALEIETRRRWKRQPLFDEPYALDEYILEVIAKWLPSDVAWAFLMWELHRDKIRSWSGEPAVRFLHKFAATWVHNGVIPGYKYHTVHRTPYPEIVPPHGNLTEPLRTEDFARDETRALHEVAQDKENETGLLFGEPLENEGGHRRGADGGRRVTSPELNHALQLPGMTIGEPGVGDDAEYIPRRAFKSPRRDRKKVRPRFELIEHGLAEAARMAGYSPEEFIAPFPRGRLSADEERRRDALADAIYKLVEAHHRQTDIAKASGLPLKTVQRLNQTGIESKCPLSAGVLRRDRTPESSPGADRAWGEVAPLQLNVLGGYTHHAMMGGRNSPP